MKKLIPVLVAIVLILIIGGAAAGVKLYEKYSYSKERADLYEYFEVADDEEAVVIFDSVRLEEKALVRDGICYLSYDTVKSLISDWFYVNEAEGIVLYSLKDRTAATDIGSAEYQVGEESFREDHPLTVSEGGTLYFAVDYLQLFSDFSSTYTEKPGRLMINTKEEPIRCAEVRKAHAIRKKGGIKSEILADTAVGDTLVCLEEMENWVKVQDATGIVGYIEKKHLGESYINEPEIDRAKYPLAYEPLLRDKKIVLGWHQVFSASANSTMDEMAAKAAPMNVISPTWYSLTDNSGNFTDISSKDYVDRAHSRGLEVWALVDNFSKDVDSEILLAGSETRKALISNLVNAALNTGVDGINIDFESVPVEAGDHFAQFLKELSIETHKNNIVLSVDNYVPKESTLHYHREVQGRCVDYVIIMGYDEHWGGGKVAGSVASIDFVEEGIQNTLESVPSEKVINAVPFYTRVWKVKDNDVDSDALGIEDMQNYIKTNGLTQTWDEVTCQNYIEFEKKGRIYQIWVEDAQSIEVKLNVMKNYDLGGVAAWKLGFETKEIWEKIAGYAGN